jgi:hypothetical protein
MPEFNFTAILKRPEGIGTWTTLDIPVEVMTNFGRKDQVKVRGTINGHPFRGSAMPHGDGSHYLVVNQAIRDAIGASLGDLVQVSMQEDQEERKVILPKDLKAALQVNPQVALIFNKLSYSHQKQYVEWIESAKKADTRQTRINKTIQMLPAGWNPKGKRSQTR